MKFTDNIQLSKSQKRWNAPQTLLLSHSGLNEKAKISRGIAFHRGWLEPRQIVENGEMAVSLLQVATQGICQIQDHLCEMESKLLEELAYAEEKPVPNPNLKEEMVRILAKIETLTEETSFKEQHLLNGKLSVTGCGHFTKILGAAPLSRERRRDPLQVEVLKMATQSVLTGYEPLTDEIIRQESQIILSENDNIAKYEISSNETVASLLQGLQKLVLTQGLDLEIQRDKHGHLQIRHNQYGSSFVFSARSENTAIVSKRPNTWQFCQLGKNCVAKIDGQFVSTRGHLLFCEKPMSGVEGLTILWKGAGPGSDHLTLENRAISVTSGRMRPQRELWISIGSCAPHALANGVQNKSEFAALSQVLPNTWQTTYDTLYLVQLSRAELEEQRQMLAITQSEFEHLAMSALDASDQPKQERVLEEMTAEPVSQMVAMLQTAFSS